MNMNIKKTIASATAAGALLANTALPLFASTQIVISGNGAGSDNYVQYNQTSNTNVQQNNTAYVNNNVNVDADTGNNDSSFNTGGNTVIDTGNATANVTVNNVLNSNSANVDCCDQGNTSVNIEGNGAWSDNTVSLDQRTNTTVGQNNYANVNNDVDVDTDTGNNDANKNTGGDTVIVTGNAKADVSLSTTANSNHANVGRDGNSGTGLSLVISGNGAGSDNWIDADLRKSTRVNQDNNAYVTNDVDVDADTGKNDADFNTGGDVVIVTGNAKADVDVNNLLNFNYADVDCGCAWNVLAKIEGNGAGKYDDNTILMNLRSDQLLGQNNYANVDNDLEDIDLDTGHNDANANTGEVDGDSDPAIVTGHSAADVDVNNTLNVNSVGDGGFDFELPWADYDFDFSFNMQALLAFLGISMS